MTRIVLVLSLLSLMGCLVSKKKYDALEADFGSARTEVADRDKKLADAAENAKTLEAALAAEKARAADLDAKIAEAEAKHRTQLDELNSEKAGLVRDKSKLKASVAEMEEALRDLQTRKAAAEARVAQYKDLLARFKKLIDSGRLQVKIVDGRMVVVLATDILFASGKAELSPEGKAALLEVGQVLAGIPERKFQVEGHTDNVPIATERFPSNWELASARSLVVVRTLIEGGVPANRVSGASYGEHRPVAANASPEGKTSNRRIEIVVVPDLSQLPGFEELQKAAGE